MINSYPNIVSFDHKLAAGILDGDDVVVEEKIDGSQFSFGLHDGEIVCKSKSKSQYPDTNDLFRNAVEQVLKRKDLLHEGWTYRCEYLQKPKHNTLAYARIPKDHLIGFDVMREAKEDYLPVTGAREEFERIGFEFVPYNRQLRTVKALDILLEHESILGGCKVEGLVIKNYGKFGPGGKTLMAKLVSERFKEAHKVEWRKVNPTSRDIENSIIERYRTEARWAKAVQHLREDGVLAGTVQDIGRLISEVRRDIRVECEDEIKEMLFAHAWGAVERGITAGFVEWYKAQIGAV